MFYNITGQHNPTARFKNICDFKSFFAVFLANVHQKSVTLATNKVGIPNVDKNRRVKSDKMSLNNKM